VRAGSVHLTVPQDTPPQDTPRLPTLRLSKSARAAIVAHGEAGYPLEVCGFLAGSAEEDGRTAVEAWLVPNAWEADPEARGQMVRALEAAGGPATADRWESADEGRRFLVDPKDVLAAMKRARAEGRELIGLYHTHPEHPAVPSDFDRSAAWPEWSYVILSVRGGQAAELRSWSLSSDDGPFVEERVIADCGLRIAD